MRFSLQKAGFFITAEPEKELNHSRYGVSVGVVVHGGPLALDWGSPGLGAVKKYRAEKPLTLLARCCLQLNLLTLLVNIHMYNI